MTKEQAIEKENELVREYFDLEVVLETTKNNDITIHKPVDEFVCYINDKEYARGYTPLFALVLSIEAFGTEL